MNLISRRRLFNFVNDYIHTIDENSHVELSKEARVKLDEVVASALIKAINWEKIIKEKRKRINNEMIIIKEGD
jgi:hypothetical protein